MAEGSAASGSFRNSPAGSYHLALGLRKIPSITFLCTSSDPKALIMAGMCFSDLAGLASVGKMPCLRTAEKSRPVMIDRARFRVSWTASVERFNKGLFSLRSSIFLALIALSSLCSSRFRLYSSSVN